MVFIIEDYEGHMARMKDLEQSSYITTTNKSKRAERDGRLCGNIAVNINNIQAYIIN